MMEEIKRIINNHGCCMCPERLFEAIKRETTKALAKQQEINNAVLADKCDEFERYIKASPIDIDKVMEDFNTKVKCQWIDGKAVYDEEDVKSFIQSVVKGEIK